MAHLRILSTLPILALLFLVCGPAGSWALAPREGILLVAFGTSVPEAARAFTTIESEYREAFPDVPIVWAYTSQIIRKKLASQGIHVGGIAQGLDDLAAKGVKTVYIQSLHMVAGEEFAALARAALLAAKSHADQFEAVYLGRPLLESDEDAALVAKAVKLALASRRNAGEGLALMAHGQEQGRGDLVLRGARGALAEEDPLIFLGTVEGSRSFEDMLGDVGKKPVKKIWLMPFMVVAGEHARNDLAGEEPDSWASRLRQAGYEVQPTIQGLGELPAIGKIFVQHTRSTRDNLLDEPRKP